MDSLACSRLARPVPPREAEEAPTMVFAWAKAGKKTKKREILKKLRKIDIVYLWSKYQKLNPFRNPIIIP